MITQIKPQNPIEIKLCIVSVVNVYKASTKVGTFEKHAPMCTLGVGGKPCEMGCCCLMPSEPRVLLRLLVELRVADLSRRRSRGGALGEDEPSSKM